MGIVRSATVILCGAAVVLLAGCSSAIKSRNPAWNSNDTVGLTAPYFNADVDAVCLPPVGWQPEPLKRSANHVHQIWLSPTGDTAYAVIHFKIPFPVGQNLALSGFLSQMKKTEGEATLIEKHDDPDLPGIRFVAQGGIYRIRANLIVATWEGWTIYAGTLKNGPILQNELDLAVRAREHTRVGSPEK